jgi:DNA-binding transcriptional regulator YiaG
MMPAHPPARHVPHYRCESHGNTPVEALQEAIEVAGEWEAAGFARLAGEKWTPSRVPDLRRSLSMTQRELAHLLNVSLSAVHS